MGIIKLAFIVVSMSISEKMKIYVFNVYMFKETTAKFITQKFRPG